MLYAVYSLCGSESSSYQLVAEAIEGLSYTVTGLPAPAQCALRVVAYHRYCLQDLDGVLRDETLPFTTAIEGTYKSRFSYIYMRGNEIWHKLFREYFHFMKSLLDRLVVIVAWTILTYKHVSSVSIVNYSVHLTQSFYQR